MKTTKHITFATLAALMLGTTGCKDWLEIQTLSIYTGESAFVDYDGMKTATVMLDRDMRYLEFYSNAGSADPAYLTELYFSDIAVNGRTDAAAGTADLDIQITPSASMSGSNYANCTTYWDRLYKGIKDANTIISRIDGATMTDTQRSEILAIAYTHRAMRYYRLGHQFGDVPLLLEEVAEPRFDFYSTQREVTLRQMKTDLDGYIQYLPDVPPIGSVGKGAAYHILTKINLALGEFDAAVTSAGAVIDGGVHSLMTSRFGTNVVDEGNPTAEKNVLWDLHRPVNKAIPANKEVLYVSIDREDVNFKNPGNGTELMRQAVPWYTGGRLQVSVPDPNTPGASLYRSVFTDKNPYLLHYGRGLATARSTWYSTNTIWDAEEAWENSPANTEGYNDLRHDRASGNWMNMEDLKFNNPEQAPGGAYPSPWYGKNLVKWDYNLSEAENNERGAVRIVNPVDTIRGWMDWPHYKTIQPDPMNNSWRGGHNDMYLFRLAETYLLRAEAHFWLNQNAQAMADINTVRARANARPITVGEVSMKMILDERARELYYEEPRKTELTRISFLYAKTGRATDDPHFSGKTYTLANLHTSNFLYDQVITYNNYYKLGARTTAHTYKISPHHILWPIRESYIKENNQGHINQNLGYPGAESNIPPIDHAN